MKKFFTLITFVLTVCSGMFTLPVSAQAIIYDQPAGELKTYDRNGYSYYEMGGYVRRGSQTGTVDIVFADGGKVYIKNPLAKLETNSWIEGTINDEGTEITVPMKQRIAYDTEVQDSLYVAVFEYDEDYEEFSISNSVKSLTYKVDGEKISLQGTSKYYVLGCAWVSTSEWAGYADYSSVYTPAVTDTLITPPAGGDTLTYQYSSTGYMSGEITYPVTVIIVNGEMYIKGIYDSFPDAWIKGTIDGNKVTFASPQYLGSLQTTAYYMIATSTDDTKTIKDFVLNYDPETGIYTSDMYLVENTSRAAIYLTDYFENVKLAPLGGSEVVFDVPYIEEFKSQAVMNNFTIIDANEDNYTWQYSTLSQCVEYPYCMNNAGDDWLITPKIRLQAGMKYTFTVKARSFTASMPERLEVKMGTEPTVAGMTTTIIQPTEVASGDYQEFITTFTVPADTIYNFGVHAISDADNMMLRVNYISIIEDGTVGVEEIIADSRESDNNVYTLDGRIVRRDATSLEGLDKGIYLYKGKKIIR